MLHTGTLLHAYAANVSDSAAALGGAVPSGSACFDASQGSAECVSLCAQYATRVRTIKNVVTQSTSTKEVIKLQKQLEYWKEQAGLSPEQRAVVDLHPIEDARFVVEQEDV